MTNVLINNKDQIEALENIVLGDDVDIYKIPRRPYDYNKGDRRFFNQQRAIEHANEEARRTGVRQVVRPDSVIPFSRNAARFWLVQAVGS